MNIFYTTVLILYLSLFVACNTTQVASGPAPCPEDLACTEEFVAISIEVVTHGASPVTLDDLTINNITDGTEIEIDQSQWQSGMAQDRNRYVILTDASQKVLQNRRVNVQVKAVKDQEELFEKTFLLGADCCHVQHYEGSLLITIE